MYVSRGGPQVRLAEPVHHRLRVLPGVDQPRGMRVPDLVCGRLERNPAVRHRPGPDPIPELLLKVRLVGIPRLLPPAPGRADGGSTLHPQPLGLIIPRPLPTPLAPALRGYVTTQSAVRIDPAVQRLAVAQRRHLLLRQPRLGAPWRRHDQLRREDHLSIADTVLRHVSAHELDHSAVELEPTRLAVLGVVPYQERLAPRMMLTGHLDHRPGHFQDARLEIEIIRLQPDRLAEPDPAGHQQR